MNYRIEKKEAFRIVGVSQPLHNELERILKLFPKCGKSALDGTLQNLTL
ncbi:MAG: hypothetical protein ACLRPW_11835 [Intestinibacter sp.]